MRDTSKEPRKWNGPTVQPTVEYDATSILQLLDQGQADQDAKGHLRYFILRYLQTRIEYIDGNATLKQLAHFRDVCSKACTACRVENGSVPTLEQRIVNEMTDDVEHFIKADIRAEANR